MKPLLSSLFILSILGYGACKKPHYPSVPPVYSDYHTGKVLNAVCGNITVQFTDGSPLGQNNWYNPTSSYSANYNHVFRVANPCTWSGDQAGTDIRFRFVQPQVQTCALCMLYAPTPDTAYNIEVVH